MLQGLSDKGYEIKKGKTVAFRKKGNRRFLRLDTLGTEYSEINLKRRILGEDIGGDVTEKKRDFSLVLDIQKIIEKNKGENYERWAKRYNLKQVAKAICFIQEHGIKSIRELIEMTDNATKRFDELTESMKAKQKRLEEIAETKKHIANYAKSRETFEAYKRSGYSKKFFEAHREELTLHKAAKAAFDELGVKKIPKVKDLNAEYAELMASKKQAYAEYRKIRDEAQELAIAERNLSSIYKMEREEEQRIQRTEQLLQEKR